MTHFPRQGLKPATARMWLAKGRMGVAHCSKYDNYVSYGGWGFNVGLMLGRL